MTFWAPWDETIEVGVGFHLLICSWDLYINRLAIHWHGCYRRFGTEFVNLQLVAVPDTLYCMSNPHRARMQLQDRVANPHDHQQQAHE